MSAGLAEIGLGHRGHREQGQHEPLRPAEPEQRGHGQRRSRLHVCEPGENRLTPATPVRHRAWRRGTRPEPDHEQRCSEQERQSVLDLAV